MSPVQNVLRQLVQRRLWPVAIVLVAALAAVPMMLAKDPEPVAPPPAPVVDNDEGELATQPIVSLAEASSDKKRRRVLGSSKNPFKVDPVKTEEPADGGKTEQQAPASDTPATGGSGSDIGGSDVSIPPSADVPTTPSAPAEPAPAPKKQYEPHELTVRFTGGDDSKRRSLKRLEPLPSAETPVLIYLGVLKDGKTAEFLVEAGISIEGDGECHPSPDECETIRLREGETEFFDVKDEAGAVTAQYQLDLIEIHRGGGGKSSKASKASKSSKASLSSKSSRSELRSVAGSISAYLP
jgi:hypothetical protein